MNFNVKSLATGGFRHTHARASDVVRHESGHSSKQQLSVIDTSRGLRDERSSGPRILLELPSSFLSQTLLPQSGNDGGLDLILPRCSGPPVAKQVLTTTSASLPCPTQRFPRRNAVGIRVAFCVPKRPRWLRSSSDERPSSSSVSRTDC